MVAQLDQQYFKSRPSKTITRLLSYSLFECRPVTTRGQWINSLVFAHFAIEKRIPKLKNVKQPIFITGSGRSGTTMLGVLMSMHKDVGFLNEPKAMWHSIYPDEDVIGSLFTCDKTEVPENLNFQVRKVYQKIYGSDSSLIRALRYFLGSTRALLSCLKDRRSIVHFHWFHVGVLELFNILLSKILFRKVVVTAHDVEAFAKGLSIPVFERIGYKLFVMRL